MIDKLIRELEALDDKAKDLSGSSKGILEITVHPALFDKTLEEWANKTGLTYKGAYNEGLLFFKGITIRRGRLP